MEKFKTGSYEITAYFNKNYWARSESISLKISEDYPCYPSLGHNSIVRSVFYKILILQSYILQRIFFTETMSLKCSATAHNAWKSTGRNISRLLSSQNAARIEHKYAPVTSITELNEILIWWQRWTGTTESRTFSHGHNIESLMELQFK